MGVHPVHRVVLRVESVLQVELGVLEHALDDVLDIHRLGHVHGGHDVQGGEAGVRRLGDSLHDKVSPQPLLVLPIVVLQRTPRIITVSEHLAEVCPREQRLPFILSQIHRDSAPSGHTQAVVGLL